MKKNYNPNTYLLTVFLYFSAVSCWRISSRIFGMTDWHVIMFQRPDQPLLDWWTWVIPCFIISFILVNFVPKKLTWFIVGTVAAFTAIWITLSYF